MVTAGLYTADMRSAWDAFVEASKTPLFFFKRDFMEYHADRFEDCSLILTDEQGQITALLPASRHAATAISHGGLTFGGMLTERSARSEHMGDILSAALRYFASHGIDKLRYKATPHIFHARPAEEDIYFLVSRFKASLVRRDLSSVISVAERPKLSKGRKALISRARQAGVAIEASTDWDGFHSLLATVLSRHGASPVHSPAELAYLASKFPDRIKLMVATHKDVMLAATLLFLFDGVTHTQYMSVSDTGKELGALDLLIEAQITEASAHGPYFSFGISTEQDGKVLNEGLLRQKESFGGRSIVLDTYEVATNA